jgi:hypothetical protein
MRETGLVPAAVLLRRFRRLFRRRLPAIAFVLLGLLAGCASAGGAPNTAGSATVVPGGGPTLGEGSGGGISVTATSIVRTGTKLQVTARIHNGQTTADELVQVGSQVTDTLTLAPPLKIPAGATVGIGGTGAAVVLDQTGRLEPGGTVALAFQFTGAGAVQVFSSFRDAA